MTRFKSSALVPLTVAVLGLVGSFLWAREQERTNSEERERRFAHVAVRAQDEVRERLRDYEQALQSLRGVFFGAGERPVDYPLFRRYASTRDIQAELPGARGLGFIRRVSSADEAALVAANRALGREGFSVKQLRPHEGERFVIELLEPELANGPAIGVDIASEENRRSAALVAAETGRAALTHPITLVQAEGQPHQGFLLLLPIYRQGVMPATPQERLQATVGWAYTPLVLEEILAECEAYNGDFLLFLSDVDARGEEVPFYASTGIRAAEARLVQRISLPIFGREWVGEVRATPQFVERLNLGDPTGPAVGLALLTLALSLWLRGYLKSLEGRLLAALEHNRVAALVENSPDGIIGSAHTGVVTHWNRGAERLFGIPANEALGQSLDALIVPEGLAEDGDAERFERARRGEEIAPFTTVRRHKDGHLLDVSIAVSAIRGNGGEVVGVSTVIRDIGAEKEVQARLRELNTTLEQQVEERTRTLELRNRELESSAMALRRAVEASEAASRAKSDFLANMSHEIRTPMNAVLGFTYLLQKAELPPDARQTVTKIRTAGTGLLAIINDILDFSKIEAGRFEIERAPFRLGDVLASVAVMLSVWVAEKPIEVVVGPAPTGADYLFGDALRLGQILTNLCSNAAKFTERGEVVLTVEAVGEREGGVVLRFSVRDTGFGIRPEQQAEVFEAFSQADSSITRKFGGTGLGLAITSRLVGLMGGALSLQSEPGKGSTFTFELPFAVSHPTRFSQPDLTFQRVLLADDHLAAREALTSTCRSLGWHVEAVGSGEEAVRAVSDASDAGRPFDLLLLDWRMPGMDGLAAAKSVRERLGLVAAPLIVMVTGAERALLQQHADARHADEVLTKPVTASSLLELLAELKSARGESLAPARAAATADKRLAGMQVLVVDDREINREVAQHILEDEGATIVTAEDGQQALSLLSASPRRFDVVLMDVQMPVLDGYQATRLIRQNTELRDLPVIALTAGAFRSQHEAALAAGMDGFIAKAFDVDELVSLLRDITRERSSLAARRAVLEGAPVEAPARAAEPEAPAPAELSPDFGRFAALPLLDLRQGVALVRSEATYKRVLGLFYRTHTDDESQLAALLAEGAEKDAASLAHKVKGSALSLALRRLAAVSAELEDALRSGAATATLLPIFTRTFLDTRAATAEYLGLSQPPAS